MDWCRHYRPDHAWRRVSRHADPCIGCSRQSAAGETSEHILDQYPSSSLSTSLPRLATLPIWPGSGSFPSLPKRGRWLSGSSWTRTFLGTLGPCSATQGTMYKRFLTNVLGATLIPRFLTHAGRKVECSSRSISTSPISASTHQPATAAFGCCVPTRRASTTRSSC